MVVTVTAHADWVARYMPDADTDVSFLALQAAGLSGLHVQLLTALPGPSGSTNVTEKGFLDSAGVKDAVVQERRAVPICLGGRSVFLLQRWNRSWSRAFGRPGGRRFQFRVWDDAGRSCERAGLVGRWWGRRRRTGM